MCCGISRFHSCLWSGFRSEIKESLHILFNVSLWSYPWIILLLVAILKNDLFWKIIYDRQTFCFNKALNFIFSSQGFEFLICSPPVNRREVDQKPLIRNNPKFRFKINPIPVFKIYPLYKWRTTKPVSCMNLANCLTVYTLIDISDWRWSGGHCQRSEWVFLQVYSCNHLGRNRSYPRW